MAYNIGNQGLHSPKPTSGQCSHLRDQLPDLKVQNYGGPALKKGPKEVNFDLKTQNGL